MDEVVYTVDEDGAVLFVSPGVERLLGYTPAEATGRPFIDFVHSDDLPLIKENFHKLLSGQSVENEYRMRHKSGEIRWIRTSSRPIYTANDNVGVQGILKDITERKQVEEKARRAETLQEIDRLKTALLASVSHELRTPLTHIRGLAGTLTQADIALSQADQHDFLLEINRSAMRLTRIVEDVIDMSRLETGTLRLEMVPSRLSTIVSQIRKQLDILIAKHEFEIELPPELPKIHCDETRIGQVITNLISNAASYSDEGTTITLNARHIEGHIEVSVTDQGPGIPSDEIKSVFDRFHRLESGRQRRTGGSGLGLSICKNIIEAHGGILWAESTVGEGSMFTFTLPIRNE